jgi:hypothetical protein
MRASTPLSHYIFEYKGAICVRIAGGSGDFLIFFWQRIQNIKKDLITAVSDGRNNDVLGLYFLDRWIMTKTDVLRMKLFFKAGEKKHLIRQFTD